MTTPTLLPGTRLLRCSLRQSVGPFVCLLFASFAGACSVSLDAGVESELSQNTCDNDDACGTGVCRSGMCQAQSTELQALLLGITPPTGIKMIAGIEFTSVVEGFEPGPFGYEIQLGNVTQLEGKVFGAALDPETCLKDPDGATANAAGDGSLPVRLTLTPRERLLGLPSPPLTAKVQDLKGTGSGSYEFALNVPPGRYDLYFEPLANDGNCVRPPLLMVDQELVPGIVELTMELPVPDSLRVAVRYPKITDDLNGFTLDVIERDSGRLLSSRARLGVPEQTESGLEYSVELAFSEVQGSETALAGELVRLSPPPGMVAPTLYVERSVVDLFQGDQGLIDQLTEIPSPVRFSSRVAIAGLPSPAPATVLLVATALDSTNPGTVAAFSQSVDTDDQGNFEVDLLPGSYRMSIEPFDPTMARTSADLTVVGSSKTQIGKTIEISSRREINGRVVSFDGSAVVGAPIWAGAEPFTSMANVLEAAQGRVRPYPTAVGGSSASNGKFSLLADAGVFRVTARPQGSSGFPWRVRLGVDAGAGDVDLGRLQLSLPLVVGGRLTSRDLADVVPNALIRAYAFVKDDQLVASREEADSVIAVGEARVDSAGRFQLLLPSVFK